VPIIPSAPVRPPNYRMVKWEKVKNMSEGNRERKRMWISKEIKTV
jgi:hypothetical protein